MNEEEWDKIKCLIKTPPELFINVGVGFVNGEAWHCKRDWRNTKIIGFEPCPRRFDQVKNSYPGLLFNNAVLDKPGKFVGSVNNYDFKIDAEDDRKDPYVPFEVDGTTIDELVKQYSVNSAFVWADVEGAEFAVVKGAIESMVAGKIIGFLLEFWPQPPTAGWARDREVTEFLQKYGYIIPKDYLGWDRVLVQDFIFVRGT